jgi:glycosyltransferase involved in cell wall biosynthesis
MSLTPPQPPSPSPQPEPVNRTSADPSRDAGSLLSVLMPLYNEEDYVGVILERVIHAPLPAGLNLEIVVVDDGSTDASVETVNEIASRYPGLIRLVLHEHNRGKGAAVRTAIQHASGDFAIIQDSDLEYDPAEYAKLLQPLLDGKADAVFGSRFLTGGERRVLYYWHALANRMLTTLCNMAADVNLTDMETCYKAFRLSLMKSIPLKSERFGIEPEMTIKLAQRQACIYEMPISYHGRTYAEGKKIGLKDAIQAVFVILRYGLRRDVYADPDKAILDSLADTPRFNRWLADTIRPFTGERILEIGAGIGNLTQHLCRGKKLYVVTDIDPEHLARLRNRFQYRPSLHILPCHLEVPEDFETLRESVDTVVCLNVVEHVEDDAAALRHIHQALCPGGRAIILVPEGPSLYGSLDKVLGHFRRYTEPELRQKMEAAGFHVEQILQFNRITRPGWFMNGRLLGRKSFDRLQLWFFDRMVWLFRRSDRWLPWKPLSIIAIGRKPSA